MAWKIQLRRGSASAWATANTVLDAGEVGVETDTLKAKIGNGTTAWTSLAYSLGGGGDPAPATHGATSKTTPVDADELPIVNSAAANVLGKVTFANLKAWVKSWITKTDVGLSAVTNNAQYFPGGTDVALADGGTGASLTAPGADRIVFYDQSAGAMAFLTPGTNLTITGTTIDAAATGGGSGYTDPLTTAGDIVVRNASASVRKAVGTNQQVLRVNTANADKLEYATLAKGDVGLGNVDNTSDATVLAAARSAAIGIAIVLG